MAYDESYIDRRRRRLSLLSSLDLSSLYLGSIASYRTLLLNPHNIHRNSYYIKPPLLYYLRENLVKALP